MSTEKKIVEITDVDENGRITVLHPVTGVAAVEGLDEMLEEQEKKAKEYIDRTFLGGIW